MLNELVQITHTRAAAASHGANFTLAGNLSPRLYEALAELLEYPGNNWPSLVASRAWLLMEEDANLLSSFSTFRCKVEKLALAELQELYTRTFDLNPVCALEVGYHLFGETYKRGLFLANLRETEAPYELGQERQLPDYLPVLLRLIGRLDDIELRDALVCDCIVPALDKMLAALGQSENPYRDLIETVRMSFKLEAVTGEDRCCATAAAI